ncbi:hypothetical protein MACH05_14650 [Qipengyuania nanhaisediminis]
MLEQTWYRINFVRFHEGKQGRASEIIKMYEQASTDSGTPSPMSMHMNSGPWHMIVAFPMTHGIAEMGWKQTPEGEAWDAAFERIAGGADEAEALHNEFASLVAQRERHIGHAH